MYILTMSSSKDLSSLRSIKFSDAVRYRKNIKPFGINQISETGQPYLHYRLPRTDVLDGHGVKHYFKAEADGDDAADDKFHSNIRSIWRSLRVQVGSEDVQYVNQVGHLAVIRDNLYMKTDERTSRAVVAQGIPALSSSGTAVRYGHRLLRNGFLDNLIPLYKIPHVEVIFELNQNLAEHTDATTAVTEVSITNPQLTLTMVKSKSLRAKIDSSDYQITFDDFDIFEDTTLSSGATSHTLVIPASHKSITGIILTMRNQADINDPNFGDDKYESAYVTNGLAKLHFTIDGQQLPLESIDCTNNVELYDYMTEYAGGSENVGPWFDGAYDTATDGKFVIFFPLSGEPFCRDSVSGTDLNSKSGQIIVEMSQMSATVNTAIRGWVRYQRVVQFAKSGSIVVSK
jgi:hypothetical protein